MEVGGGGALSTLSTCLSLKVALFFLLLHLLIYKYLFFLIEAKIRNEPKGGKPDKKPYHLLVSGIHKKQLKKKIQVCSR
jgi:hypothetical protein